MAQNGSKQVKKDKWTGQGQVKMINIWFKTWFKNMNHIHSEEYSHFNLNKK
jgi:hypothetical protein